MTSAVLADTFADFARLKDIDRPTMIRILEDVFRTIIRKKFNFDENFDVIINVDKGDLEIWRNREIVENNLPDFDENLQIRLQDAVKIEEDFEVGEEVAEEVKIEDFGRRLVQTALQNLRQKVKELEKDILYNKYKDMEGRLITGEVYQVLSREIVVIDAEKKELSLPRQEQMIRDRFRKGENIKAVVHRVRMFNNNPKIILSRTSPVFLERLIEQEVPEVFDGLITVKKVVRVPGERAKIAVESYDDRIDPVGACVGMKGSRIHAIVRELHNENIDVINYTDNTDLYISRVLSPAKVNTVKIDIASNRVAVYLDKDQVSKAIGKNGQNIKLASRLVGMEMDVFRELGGFEEDEEDVELSEFNDVFDQWMIEELQKIGLDTAKSVLAVSQEDLVRRTDLEEESIAYIVDILKKEFE